MEFLFRNLKMVARKVSIIFLSFVVYMKSVGGSLCELSVPSGSKWFRLVKQTKDISYQELRLIFLLFPTASKTAIAERG